MRQTGNGNKKPGMLPGFSAYIASQSLWSGSVGLIPVVAGSGFHHQRLRLVDGACNGVRHLPLWFTRFETRDGLC